MKDQTENLENTASEDEDEDGMLQEDELTTLKARAKMMGIKFSNNISLKSLRDKINASLEAGSNEVAEEPEEEMGPSPVKPVMTARARIHETRNHIRKEANKLIRIRYTNMNPQKKNVPGEWFTAANSYIGTIRKYVPFDEAAENGWHVPYAIYQQMKERKYASHKKRKDAQGREYIESKWLREFNIEVLPPLTQEELKRIERRQMADRSDSEE